MNRDGYEQILSLCNEILDAPNQYHTDPVMIKRLEDIANICEDEIDED